MVFKFKNSVLVQKSIKSAIQRHLFFFSSEIDQERDPKYIYFIFSSDRTQSCVSKDHLLFFRLRLWVDIAFFRSSSELVSKTFIFFQFRNRSRARSKDIYFFSVQKSINSAIQRLLIFVFRLSSAYVILCFQIELRVGF